VQQVGLHLLFYIYCHPLLAEHGLTQINPLLLCSFKKGAATTCYVAMHPQVKGISGKYFANCNIAIPSSQASDAELAKKLWQFSLQTVVSSWSRPCLIELAMRRLLYLMLTLLFRVYLVGVCATINQNVSMLIQVWYSDHHIIITVFNWVWRLIEGLKWIVIDLSWL
jgi:hypothetical protein